LIHSAVLLTQAFPSKLADTHCPLPNSEHWAAPLFDGDLPLDCSIDIEPLDLAWAKLQLDQRRNALESSALTPGRQVAIEQVAGL